MAGSNTAATAALASWSGELSLSLAVAPARMPRPCAGRAPPRASLSLAAGFERSQEGTARRGRTVAFQSIGSQRENIDSLTGLRFIAAFAIALGHTAPNFGILTM